MQSSKITEQNPGPSFQSLQTPVIRQAFVFWKNKWIGWHKRQAWSRKWWRLALMNAVGIRFMTCASILPKPRKNLNDRKRNMAPKDIRKTAKGMKETMMNNLPAS